LEEIQMDFKDVGSVSPEQSPQGKRQHVIEVCNFVDAGTSIALWAQVREDFHEQTALETVITFLRRYGRPRQMTFDRDPRWVGGVSGRDFPSPLRRLLLCVGITPHVCPPHRPDKNRDVLLPVGPGKSDSRLFGGRELDFVLPPPAFSGACSHWSTCGKTVVSLLDKDAGNQKPSAA
jgi:hypothetical protein